MIPSPEIEYFEATLSSTDETISASFDSVIAVPILPSLQDKTATPLPFNEVVVTADEDYYGLDTVTVERIPYTERDNLLGGKTIIIG